uniref:Uncharacterized protein n=1 Tax=viral metagenome TaxID=1070528 RepID=A0A6M3LIC5_9ZZZZ
MKYIEVMRIITTLKGEPMKLSIEVGQKEPTLMTVKEILLQYLGGFGSISVDGRPAQIEGKKQVMAYNISLALYRHKIDMFEVEDAEFELIKESLKVAVHGALILGQVRLALDEAEERAKKKAEKEKEKEKKKDPK